MNIAALAETIRTSRGLAGKRDIDAAVAALGLDAGRIKVGDDCAAIPDGDGFLLFAIEGFIPAFVTAEPWFAGYCGVMVNLSDIAAMGGRPIAIVDALWSAGEEAAAPILGGLRAASEAYGVPIVGGHTNSRSDASGLSVAVLGRAKTLLTSFDAQPGDDLVAAIELRGGRYTGPGHNWNASTGAPAFRLRADLEILPTIAEAGLCIAAKDISMAGLVGTAAMLMECSGVGGMIDVAAVPRPNSVPLDRWLLSFPSYGYLLSVRPDRTDDVLKRFTERGIAAARIGRIDASHRLRISDGADDAMVWDFTQNPLIGCGIPSPVNGRRGDRPVSRPLRIAILTHSTNPRGGVVHALSVADALADLGHEAVVHAPDPSGRGFFRQTRCGTVSVPAASTAGLGTPAMVEQRVGEYTAFFGHARNRGFDIYHAQDGIGGNALADLEASGLITGFVRTVHHLDVFADPTLAARQIRGVAAAAKVFCVSDHWRDTLRRDFGIVADRVDNGVDRNIYSPDPSPIDEVVRRRWGLGHNPVFLSVGGFEARKNSLGLIEAFARLRRDLPHAQLVVVGGASVLDHSIFARRCAEALKAHGLEAGPGKSVIVTGPVAAEDMPAFYRLADTLVFPSLNEGFGLAVVEAMASGTPVIVSRIAPFTEYLGEEDTFWVDPARPETIAAAMRASLDETRRLPRISRGKAVAARFDWADSARRHLDLYQTLVHREVALA